MKLDSVAVPAEEVLSVVTCVQHFVREPDFTQRSFFTENGLALLNAAISSSGEVSSQANYNPWSGLKVHSKRAAIRELSQSYEVVMGRRRGRNNNLERLYAVACTSSDIASEVGSQAGVVKISEVVEEGSVVLGSKPVPSGESKLCSILKSAKRVREKTPFAFASSP